MTIKSQKKGYGPKFYVENGVEYQIVATVRHDDECGNGHNSFSITGRTLRYEGGQWRENSVGCIHNLIAEHFPELAPFIKWHLCNTDGPMHYIADTTYHASDRDCHGLRKGEFKQIRNCWKLVASENLPSIVESDEPPTATATLRYVPYGRTGEGKEPDLEAARQSAIWPDATLEQLQDKELLAARLPGLLAEFKKDVESLGLKY